jgi:phospholipid transport system substrate-binding protein
MTRFATLHGLALAGVVTLLGASTARAESDVEKPVSVLVKSVRYTQDAKALKQLDTESEGKILLGDDWAKGTAAQRTEFQSLFQTLFAGLAFPKLRDNLQNLGTTLFDKPEVSGETAKLTSTLVIDHPLKKQEIRARFDMRNKGGWKVVDVTILGVGKEESMLTGIRNEQIIPIMAQGGWAHLLDAMRQRAEQIKKK